MALSEEATLAMTSIHSRELRTSSKISSEAKILSKTSLTIMMSFSLSDSMVWVQRGSLITPITTKDSSNKGWRIPLEVSEAASEAALEVALEEALEVASAALEAWTMMTSFHKALGEAWEEAWEEAFPHSNHLSPVEALAHQ